MKKTDIEKLKGKVYLYHQGDHVVVPGAALQIFRTDGSLAAKRKDIRFFNRRAFLSGDRMLVLSARNNLHLISLADGSDLWVQPWHKFDCGSFTFALTADEAYAYSYENKDGTLFLIRLNLSTREVERIEVPLDTGATKGILCDSRDIPCLLKSQYLEVAGRTISENGVRLHDWNGTDPGTTFYWKSKWTFDAPRIVFRFLDGTEQLLTEDLYLYDPATDTLTDLVENDPCWQRPEISPSDAWLDTTGRYLCLQYMTANTILDLQERRVAAQYAADYNRGVLIGNEYWLSTDAGVRRYPFPSMEEMPPFKPALPTFWGLTP